MLWDEVPYNPENRDTVDLDDIYGQSFHESNRILFLHENEPFAVSRCCGHPEDPCQYIGKK